MNRVLAGVGRWPSIAAVGGQGTSGKERNPLLDLRKWNQSTVFSLRSGCAINSRIGNGMWRRPCEMSVSVTKLR